METRGGINISRSQLHSDGNVDSPNLRDFLRIKDDDNNNYNGRTSFAGQTLGSALSDEKRGESLRVQSNRTLLDIIRDDPTGGKDSKKSWRQFKEKLRLRRQGSGASWTSTVPIPASDVPIHQNSSSRRMISRRDSTRMNMSNSEQDDELSSGGLRSRSGMLQRNTSRAVGRSSRGLGNFNDPDDAHEEAVEQMEEEEGPGETGEDDAEAEGEGEGEGGGRGGQPAVRMSLMTLLAETDKQMGLDGSAYMMNDDDDDDEEEEEKGVGEYNNCCVCMVRHKGSAFIPCGHTFCRLCSRELWVQRGNCPLCNNFILEILDIF